MQGTAGTFLKNQDFTDDFKMIATKPKLPAKWTHIEWGTFGGVGVSITNCLKFDHTGLIYWNTPILFFKNLTWFHTTQVSTLLYA